MATGTIKEIIMPGKSGKVVINTVAFDDQCTQDVCGGQTIEFVKAGSPDSRLVMDTPVIFKIIELGGGQGLLAININPQG